MDIEIKELIESLKYISADSIKKLQTKLTKTANSIEKDALQKKLTPFYTKEEIETLSKSANILRSVKSKVEHVKEIKKREELKEENHRHACKVAQEKMIINAFPKPESNADFREALLWNLAGSIYTSEMLGRHAYFSGGIEYVRKDIARWSEKKTSGVITETLKRSALKWWSDLIRSLNEDLFHYRTMPDEQKITDLKIKFNAWRQQLEVTYADILQAFDNEVAANENDSVVRLRTVDRSRNRYK